MLLSLAGIVPDFLHLNQLNNRINDDDAEYENID